MTQLEAPLVGRPKTPKTKARLERLITDWQKSSGQPVARLNLRIAAMMIAGALARVVGPDDRAAFAIKGGMAMELRLGDRARATRDIDLILRGDTDRLADLLDAGLGEPYNGFAFRRREIGDHPVRPDVKQVEVQVIFARKVLCTPKLEIAPAETGREEFAALPARVSTQWASTDPSWSRYLRLRGRSRRSSMPSLSAIRPGARTRASVT